KILLIFVVIPTFIYAAYNPFFRDSKPEQTLNVRPKEIQKTVIQHYKPRPKQKRKTIKMTYFGFIESNKGIFALVRFKQKNIVIRKNDSLYDDDEVFKIKKITSNYILIRDRKGRAETVYFSSAQAENQQYQVQGQN
ncbi:MAG: hypothetical protein U9Q40_10190, partial [Campylobacterota bacterium]|nr:hypothetical protein [Campylobacterota bacterium]